MARSKELLGTVWQSGAVVFVQRFGSAANLNVHLHILAIDGVYEVKSTGRLKHYGAKAPSEEPRGA